MQQDLEKGTFLTILEKSLAAIQVPLARIAEHSDIIRAYQIVY